MQANFGQLTWCYEQALRRDPSVAGRIDTRWMVEDGRVTRAEVVGNETGDDVFAECLLGKIRSWQFPPEVGGEIDYPFIFKSKSGS